MKKVLYLSISVNLFIALIFGVVFVQRKSWNDFLSSYQRVSIGLDSIADGSFDIESLYEDLQAFSESYQVNVLQFQFSEESILDIFSTNIKYDENFISYTGNHPQEHLFLSTEKEGASEDQIGILNFTWSSNRTIRVFDLPQARNTGLWGDFKLSGDLEHALAFVSEFSKYGEVSIGTVGMTPFMMLLDSIDQSLLIILVFSTLISFSVIFFSILRNRKRIFLNVLWGRSKGATLLYLPTEIGKFMLKMMLIYFILLSLYLIYQSQMPFLFFYFKNFLMIYGALICLFSLFAIFGTFFILKVYNIANSIKNKSFIKKFVFFAFFTKSVFTVLMVYLIIATLFHIQHLRKELDGLDFWKQTENIYRATFHYDYRLNDRDLSYDHNMNHRFANFYHQIKRENGAFIMFSENFHRLDYDELGNPLFDHHLYCPPEQFYYINCKAIKIDEGYLSKQFIITTQEENVLDLVLYNDYTLNLLVPIAYQGLETEIRDYYLDYFYFQKIGVANLYRDAMNEVLVEASKEELSVNIIYTANNQSYFTYNPHTGNFENKIADPIAVVFTDNLDPSLIASVMTASLFFVDEIENQAYESLESAKEEHELVELRSVQSVYRYKGEIISEAQIRLARQTASVIITLGITTFLQFSMVWGFYQLYSHKLTLQYLFGYNFFKIHGKLLMFLLLGYLPIVLAYYVIQNLTELRQWQLARLSYFFLGAPLHLDLSFSWVLRGMAVFILFECVLIYVIGKQQMKANIEKSMKGDYI